MRLDKFLSIAGFSRSKSVDLIKKGAVKVNENVATKKEFKINENVDNVFVCGKKIEYQKFIYLMLNKPCGVITATEDSNQKTVLDLFDEKILNKKVFPVGRLDKDTCGLLLITNDGDFCHKMISPKHCTQKIYKFELAESIFIEQIKNIENGVELKDGNKTLPCKIKMFDEKSGTITLTEGKYHEVRRLFASQKNKVVFLQRIQEGTIILDKLLKEGEYRFLTQKEIEENK